MVSGRVFVEGTLFSSQFDGLGDGRQRIRDGLNFDLSPSTVAALPDPRSKPSDDNVAFDASDAVEERADAACSSVVAPMGPIFFSSPGSRCNDAMGHCFPRKQEITRISSPSGMWNSVQD